MELKRSCGLILHPTSLPGPFGIGTLGDQAFQFIEFLRSSGQSFWQVLPLGPAGCGNSPYQSPSCFAGNPLLIDPLKLVEKGFLPGAVLNKIPPFPSGPAEYGGAADFKKAILEKSYLHFLSSGTVDKLQAFAAFCSREAYWLDDFALFMALRGHYHGRNLLMWQQWPEDIARHKTAAVKKWQHRLSDRVEENKFQQFLFFSQWGELKKEANRKGISIIGDIPIFTALASADVWANQELFDLNKEGYPNNVGGVPPDYFSPTGQLWGNPLYNWPQHRKSAYSWWQERIAQALSLFDIVRIDHFRGFESCWQVAAGSETAAEGKWLKGPGAELFSSAEKDLSKLSVIAEDLGVITPEVKELRESLGFPGMKVLQFAFGGGQWGDSIYLPHSYSPNCVVYTGTHDNDTVCGWYHAAPEKARDHVRRYLGVNGSDIAWDLIRLAYSSVACLAMTTPQDLLKLGSEARFNLPGTPSGNWEWRLTAGMLTQEIAGRLSDLAELYGRKAGGGK
jgi:4-alpha-glucanotransferase